MERMPMSEPVAELGMEIKYYEVWEIDPGPLTLSEARACAPRQRESVEGLYEGQIIAYAMRNGEWSFSAWLGNHWDEWLQI